MIVTDYIQSTLMGTNKSVWKQCKWFTVTTTAPQQRMRRKFTFTLTSSRRSLQKYADVLSRRPGDQLNWDACTT